MTLQILVTILVLFFLSEIWINLKRKELSLLSFIFWVSVWGAILVVVWEPGITFNLAQVFHIQRGIDSVVYLSIVALFYVVFRLILKLEKIERRIERIVREISLKNTNQ